LKSEEGKDARTERQEKEHDVMSDERTVGEDELKKG
jgi:hypothetical protein